MALRRLMAAKVGSVGAPVPATIHDADGNMLPDLWIDDASGDIYANGSIVNSDAAGESVQVCAADGPVTLHQGVVLITKGSAAALTLTQPTAGSHPTGEDGQTIRFVPTTAFAHTITTAANGLNGNKRTLTLVPPSSGLMVAYNGVWYVVTNNAGTLS